MGGTYRIICLSVVQFMLAALSGALMHRSLRSQDQRLLVTGVILLCGSFFVAGIKESK